MKKTYIRCNKCDGNDYRCDKCDGMGGTIKLERWYVEWKHGAEKPTANYRTPDGRFVIKSFWSRGGGGWHVKSTSGERLFRGWAGALTSEGAITDTLTEIREILVGIYGSEYEDSCS